MASDTIEGAGDIYQKDLYGDLAKSAKDALPLMEKLNKVLKTTTASNLKLVESQIKDVEGLKKVTEGVNNTNKAFNQKLALDKETIKLEQKLKANRTKQAQQNEVTKVQISTETRARKALAKETLNLTGAYTKESAKLNDLRKKYKNLAISEKGVSKEQKILLSQITKLDTKLKKIDATVGQSQRNVGNYGSAFSKAGGALKGFAGALGITAGLSGLVRVMSSSIKIAKEFEQGNANLASVLGTTKDKITALTDDAKRLGAATSFSATQVSTLQTEFAKLGFNEKEILNATEATLDLAAATGSDLGEAAAITGATLGGFGLDAKETGRVADVMAKSFSTSALDLEKFKEAMKGAAPAAKAVGISVEETTALLGTLANAGISGSKAGNNLKTSFINLNAAGLTLEQGLEKVAKSEDKLGTAAKLVGKNAAASFLVLSEGVDTTKELTIGFQNAGGAAKRMADEQLDTLEGKTKILGSAWEGLVLSLLAGDGAFSSISKGLVEAATSMLSFLTASEDANEVSYESAIANRDLADSSQALLNEYQDLVADGIAPTAEEKKRLDAITLELTDNLGDSVVAINKETGAMELNTDAVKAQIKSKRFASDQEAATLASRLKGVQETIKEEERKEKRNQLELKTRREINKSNGAEAQSINDIKNISLKTGNIRNTLNKEQKKSTENLDKSIKKLRNTQDGLNDKREEEADLIKKLEELNFSAADVEALFTEEVKKNTEAIAGNNKEKKKRKDKDEGETADELAKRLKKEFNARAKIQLELDKLEIKRIKDERERKKRELQLDFEEDVKNLDLTKDLQNQLEIEKREELRLELQKVDDKFDKIEEDNKKKQDKIEEDNKKKKAKKLLDIEKQNDNERQKIADENAKKQAKIDDEILKVQKAALAKLEEAVLKSSNKKIEDLDEQFEASKENENRLRDLAAKGSLDAQQSISVEAKKQADLKRAKEKEERKQELVSAGFKIFSSLLDQGKNPQDATLETAALLGALPAIIEAIPTAFEGTESTGTVKNQLDSNGGRLMLLHDNERVMTEKQNNKMGGIGNDEAANIIEKYNMGELFNHNSPDISGNLISSINLNGLNKGLERKIDTLNESIKAIKMPKTSMEADYVRQILKVKTQTGNKIITEISKLH
jgi:hypothetical protein